MAKETLQFTPSYVIVGVYRLLHDPKVRNPVWDKCRHGLARGAAVAGIWTVATYGIQHAIVKLFLLKTPSFSSRVSSEEMFGYKIPLPLATYATIIFMSSQITGIIKFFLSKNLSIAKLRAWDQVVASREKDATFWEPYVEEWEKPPKVKIGGWEWERWVGGFLAKFVIRNLIVVPLNMFIPFAGIPISATIKAVSTARNLHAQYFVAKKMTPLEIATFMEERKLDYYAFGFTAALVEMIPILGLLFSVSNRCGAAMWAFDLEKRQHQYSLGVKKPKPPRTVNFGDGTSVEMRPTRWGKPGGDFDAEDQPHIAGSWVDVKGEQVASMGGSVIPGEGVVAEPRAKDL